MPRRILNAFLGNRNTRAHNELVVPRELEGQIYIDQVNQEVLASENLRKKTNFLEWLDETRRHQNMRLVRVKWVSLSTVTDRLDHDHHAGGIHDQEAADEEVRDHALALLKDAASWRATDIHIMRKDRHTEIQFRINGSLVTSNRFELENAYADRLMRALYSLGGSRETAYSDLSFQDGSIAGDVLRGMGLSNVRIVRGPCFPVSEGGKFMVLRLQPAGERSRRPAQPAKEAFRPPRRPPGKLRLESYGFSPEQIERLLNIVNAPSGILICTGPTGSGKTTLLYELARHKADMQPGRRLVTIEHPVELPMPWAIQLDIANTGGDTGRSAEAVGQAFRARQVTSLRMDPDDLVVGEIRDADVALTTIAAAQTGHFVMSTLHVDDLFDVPLRLRNLDYERLNFGISCNASVVRGLVAQRLLPVICPSCAKSWTVNDERMTRRAREAVLTWGDDPSAIRRIGPGCEHCNGTGIAGRTAVAEVVETDEQLMSDFNEFGVSGARHRFRARKDVDPPLVETARGRVGRGRGDPYAVTQTVDRIRARDVVLAEREAGARRGRRERDA